MADVSMTNSMTAVLLEDQLAGSAPPDGSAPQRNQEHRRVRKRWKVMGGNAFPLRPLESPSYGTVERLTASHQWSIRNGELDQAGAPDTRLDFGKAERRPTPGCARP